ncbi:glycosyl transferase [Microbacterium dauci]|uniref:Glycosyl transferase n=1 Tax=Microbacterium dauci TaxID=3048008 RepID=A0ABT6ZD42_9MICO|nr:glycosyl transferase [Microbacterium sp. LX3-4]MDJ1113655.1 glycosyl transferase [Microbacterium sp. LX3-4]
MRFVWAITAFVLATLMIGAGIAQRTVLQAPATESATLTIEGTAPYVLVDGEVFSSRSGAQRLKVDGDGDGVFASYGRTSDLQQWLAATDYAHVTLDPTGAPTTDVITASAEPEGDPVATPVGSDLWLDEYSGERSLTATLQLPSEMSVLLASDGTAPAPSHFSISWPTTSSTPWAGPLIVGGGIVLLAGVVLYILGLRHVRRSRGPRRKGLPMAVTEPIDLALEQGKKGVVSATPGRRFGRGRRAAVVAPALLVVGALSTACTPSAWPDLAPTGTPTPSESVIVPEGQGSPVVTESQAKRILGRIAEQVAAADEAADTKLAARRLAGPALNERRTNYVLQKELDDQEPLAAIPTAPITAFLPEAQDAWPRMFLAVVEGEDGAATVMTVRQEDPWSDYKLTYLSSLRADASMNLAASHVGAVAVAPDSPFLVMQPGEVAASYADVLNKGDDSEYAAMFDEESDPFRAQVAENRATLLKNFNRTGEETGKVSFRARAGDTDPLSLLTLDSGAIVAVTVVEHETVVPTDDDAVIKLGKNVVAKALSGVTQSKTGFTTRYADQLYFFVPAQGSNEQIQLIASRSNVLDTKVVDEE